MSHRKIRISLDNGRTWVEVDSGPPQIETEVSFELNPPDQSEVTGCQVHLGSADDTWEDTAALSSGEPIQWTPGEDVPVPSISFGFTIKIPRDAYEWQRPRNSPELS